MPEEYKKVFVTVGTTRFDLLCDTIMTSPVLKALKKIGCKEITLQIGNSAFEVGEYEKEGVKVNAYRFKDSIQENIKGASLVISHAGAGSCLETLEANKPLLVVVNEDLMDNHQLELAEQLQVDGHLYYCTCDTLENTLEEVDFSLLAPFPKPDATLFVKYLDDIFRVKQHVE
ncbi:UDP-N-acetylglucosamine transferase subunit ALG13 homolog [Pectinophora gossypiella]|uniref:UDP-N-acetylglucosamine transferase subunit ALG13 homolog n=1 Tax=Pectinophora gossypiella TaxID=13191 RepID=UPI00214E2F5E|nr:UDP-N-acetylglucosamine transferase subunit ALG13 homolog [Pectinophora gossypiella]